jgi:formyl-CoA transferase
MKVGVGIADVMCGMYASIGILAALRHAEATGQGQQIDLSLVDSQMAWLINEGVNTLITKQPPKRRGNGHPNIVPYDVFETLDGHIILAVGNDSQFKAFCGAIERHDLASDTDFTTNPLRIENRTRLNQEIVESLKARTSADVLKALHSKGVPAGPIHKVDEALNSNQAQARDTVVRVDAPTVDGHVDLLGNPLKFSETPVTYRKAPPRFGQDSADLDTLLAQWAKKGTQ